VLAARDRVGDVGSGNLVLTQIEAIGHDNLIGLAPRRGCTPGTSVWATSAELSGLAAGRTYYWQVRACADSGCTVFTDANGGSGHWAFTTVTELQQDPAILRGELRSQHHPAQLDQRGQRDGLPGLPGHGDWRVQHAELAGRRQRRALDDKYRAAAGGDILMAGTRGERQRADLGQRRAVVVLRHRQQRGLRRASARAWRPTGRTG